MRIAKQQVHDLYDVLKLISEQDPEVWQAKIDRSKLSIDEIYRTLLADIANAVTKRTTLSGDAARDMANGLIDLDEIKAGLDAMREAPIDDRNDALEKEKLGFGQSAKSAIQDASSEVAKVDPGTNDKNVKFEAGVGIEGYVGAGTPSQSEDECLRPESLFDFRW